MVQRTLPVDMNVSRHVVHAQ